MGEGMDEERKSGFRISLLNPLFPSSSIPSSIFYGQRKRVRVWRRERRRSEGKEKMRRMRIGRKQKTRNILEGGTHISYWRMTAIFSSESVRTYLDVRAMEFLFFFCFLALSFLIWIYIFSNMMRSPLLPTAQSFAQCCSPNTFVTSESRNISWAPLWISFPIFPSSAFPNYSYFFRIFLVSLLRLFIPFPPFFPFLCIFSKFSSLPFIFFFFLDTYIHTCI